LGASGDRGAQAEDADDPFCFFWRGDDPRIHAELCELLNEEGIPHKTIRREDHLFNLNPKNAFQIGIPFSQFEKAEAAVKDAYGSLEEQKDAARLLPYGNAYAGGLRGAFPWRPSPTGFARADGRQDDEPESMAASVPEAHEVGEQSQCSRLGWDPENWNPQEATSGVWSSEESYPGEIIALALAENQIHARFEKEDGKNAIFVLPEDEARAGEIVREIAEGAQRE
jgi:hypothetical protein